MKNTMLFLVLAFFSVCLGCNLDINFSDDIAPLEHKSTIEGQIINITTQKPIEDGSIRLKYNPCDTCSWKYEFDRTGSDGRFKFEITYGHPPGEYFFIGTDELQDDYTYPVFFNGKENTNFLGEANGKLFHSGAYYYNLIIELTPK